MSDNDPDPAQLQRRRVLQALAASGVAVSLAGCGGTSTETTTDTTTESGAGDTSTTTTTTETTTTETTQAFEPQGPGDKQYIAGSTSEAQNLNPLNISDEATSNRLALFYDGGSVTGNDKQFEGRWLESWTLSEDATTVDYKIRDGLQWGADYGQLTADDYMAFFNNIVFNKKVGYTQTGSYKLGGKAIEFEKTGKLSFRANLPQSRANWLYEDPARGAYVLPQEIIEKYANPGKTKKIDGKEVGPLGQIARDPAVKEATVSGNLGPFNFESWSKGQKLVVSKNQDYYLADTDVRDGAFQNSPLLDSYTYQVFDQQSTAYSALKAGDITSTGVEGRKVSEVGGSDGVKIWESKFGSGLFYLNLNHRVNGWKPIRESRQVRQAFAHLLDKQTLIEQIFEGHANPADTFHPRWGPYYSDDKIVRFDPSIEKAKQKFEQGTSGDYGYDSQGTFLGPDGQQVELKLVIVNTSKTGKIVGNFLKQRLKEAGIKANIEGNSFGKVLVKYLQNSVKNNPNFSGEPSWNTSPYNGGAYDEAIGKNAWDILYGVGFSASVYAPWQVIKLVLTPKAQFNYIGYTTDDFDIKSAVENAAQATSREEAISILSELFGFLSRDQPLNWAFNDNTTIGYRQPVEGLPEPKNFFTNPNSRLLDLRTAE